MNSTEPDNRSDFLGLEEVRAILEIVREAGFAELNVRIGDLALTVTTGTHGRSGSVVADPSRAPVEPLSPPTSEARPSDQDQEAPPEKVVPSPTQPPASPPSPETEPGTTVVKAPLIGTFYRCPEPGKPPFVELEQVVEAGQTLCLVETMKLFNSISSPVRGKVTAILAEDGETVEYDQAVLVIVEVKE